MASTRLGGLLRVLLFAIILERSSASCWKDTPCDSRFTETAFPGPWEANILAPASRTVTPKFVVAESTTTAGSATRAAPLSRSPFDPITVPLLLERNGSQLVFDFGQEVGGLVTLRYTVSQSRKGSGAADGDDDERAPRSNAHTSSLGLAFTESSDFIGQWSDASNGAFQGPDGAIYVELADADDNENSGERVYTMPDASLRGGFRYLTVFLVAEDENTETTVALHNVTLDLAFQPTWPNLRAYQGYFDCDDPLLNRIWYAGAYTLQTNAVPPTTGRRVPFLKRGWANDGVLGPGHTILVDGAKRDRAVWPGDMGVAVPSLFVSTGDMESVKNALQTMYDNQNKDGSFPEAGPPLLQQGSDTYHMWTMIGTYNYVLYTNDTAFLARNWDGYRRAMAFITAKQAGASGLLQVTGVRDWARLNVGGNMTEAQVILHQTLATGAELATWMGAAASDAAAWAAAAGRLLSAALAHCYDPQAGLLRDSALPSAAVHPQDANALALALGILPAGIAANISAHLLRNWLSAADPYPVAPELPGHVSPFVSSWEVRGHLAAGETDRALDLMRAVWGRYLGRPDGSQSTLVEGLLVGPPSGQPSFAYRWNRGYGGARNDTAVAASYTSHSHGWSAGPTSALTELVLGLAVAGAAGSAWRFAPQLGRRGPGRAEGGFVTALGRFQASWKLGSCPQDQDHCDNSSRSYEATVSTPPGTSGVFVLPVPGGQTISSPRAVRVVVNDRPVALQEHHLRVVGHPAHQKSVVVLHVQGGKHTIQVSHASV